MDDFKNPLEKKPRKKNEKQYRYKDIFDNSAKPMKKITVVKNKKKLD